MATGFTPEFQMEIMRYLLQQKDGKQYISMLDQSIFDLPTHQLVFEMAEKYLKKYNSVPKRTNMMEFWNDAAKDTKNKVTPELRQVVEQTVYQAYESLESETAQIREKIIEFAQYKKTKKLFEENAPKLKEGNLDTFRKMKNEMSKIVQIGEDDSAFDPKNASTFMMRDMGFEVHNPIEATPCFLNGMNRLTADGGFFPPQLQILMGGPKSFKTGLMIKLAVEWARMGKKVFIADAENGKRRMTNRIKQCMLECTTEELRSGEQNALLEELAMRYKTFKGEVVVKYFPAQKCSMTDVDAELQQLKEEHGFEPDVLVIDYADLFNPVDSKITDVRHKLKAVYFDIIRLNAKWDMFALSPTPVNKKAVDKEVMNIGDFAEDFSKAYNCHGAWALCRTDIEKKDGTARLIPITQRDGVSYVKDVFPVPQVILRIDESRMFVEETTFEDLESKAKEDRSERRKRLRAIPETDSKEKLGDD